MPKTTKRTASKHAARIARAHSTELPQTVVKETKDRRRPPGYKPPARGIARYPWATAIVVLLIALGIGAAYFNHVGPFALPPKPKPKPQPHPVVTKVTSTVDAPSPCNAQNILKQITNDGAGPSDQQIAATQHTYKNPPPMTIDLKKTYCAGINTDRGLIVIELDPNLAPKTVNNFVSLAQNHFYDGLVFHRVLQGPNRIIQTGDPYGKDPVKRGTGGPGYKFNDEPVKGDYTTGTVAMANSGPNTNGSQFFINLSDNTKAFQKVYNLFGHVVRGLNVAQLIQGPGDNTSQNVQPDAMNYVIVVPAS